MGASDAIKMVDVDLFSGAGGATLGMRQAVNRSGVIFGYDNWPHAVATHRLNGLTPMFTCDLMERDWCNLPYAIRVMWASPPCQPFSQAGRNKGAKDKRDCVPAWMMAVRDAQPLVTIMENVSNLGRRKSHADYLRWVVSEVESYGYRVEWRLLDASDYGVCQHRIRFVLIARRDGVDPQWPEPKGCTLTMAQTLGWDEPRCLYPDDPEASWVFERCAATVVGTFAPEVMAKPVYRSEGDGPRQKARGSVVITEAEAAKLQGFPDGFEFSGPKTARWLQIGNAVPAPMVRMLVEANMPEGMG